MTNIRLLHLFPELGNGGTEDVILKLTNFINKNSKAVVGICAYARSGERLDDFRKVKIEIFDNPYFRKNKRFISNIMAIRLSIKKFRPNIVHTHSLYALLMAFIIRKLFGLKFKIIHTGHGGPRVNYDKIAIKFVKLADIYIAISRSSYQFLRKNTKSEKIELIYNGTDQPYESEIYNHLKNDFNDTLKLGFIGRLTKQKGLEILIRAVDIIYKTNINVELDIIGNGENSQNLKQLIKSNGLGKLVCFRGFVNDPWKYLSNTAIIVMPSLWEPGGLVAIEGIVRNHTLVASNIGGLKEIINDGKNGYLFEKGNIDQLAHLLLNIFHDQKYIKLSPEYRKKYYFNFSTGPSYLRVYKKLIQDDEND